MNLKPAERILIKTEPATTNWIKCVSYSDLADELKSLNSTQRAWVEQNQFNAAAMSMLSLPDSDAQVIWLGTGSGDKQQLRDSAAWLSQQLKPGQYRFQSEHEELALGWALGQYRFEYYKADKKVTNQLVISETLYDSIAGVINGMFITRDLINTPTNDMGPSHLAEFVKSMAIEYGAYYSAVVDQELLQRGFRTIYAVGQAAENRPRLIELRWGNETHPRITLVGKGVCFDTGGLDIKPSAGMRIMKKDMGGAAHALGLASMIMAANLNVNLRVLIPAVENSISDNAYRPGDIIKTYKGTTVEIDNTDAEGRLVLCDALTLACEEEPELLIDFATLTGAARVAMGTAIVPYFSDDETFVDDLKQHANDVLDPVWQLPLFPGYEADLKSPVADMSNMGKGPFGGAITAALFLKHFVAEKTPWAHFDLFGWNSATKPTCPEGGQSMAIHAVYAMLTARYSQD